MVQEMLSDQKKEEMLSAAVGIGRAKLPYRGTVNRQSLAGPAN